MTEKEPYGPPYLNVTCNNERNAVLANKKGQTDVLRCCSELLMCDCMNRYCENDQHFKQGPWCKQLKSQPCTVSRELAHKCNSQICSQLANRYEFVIIGLIIVAILVALAILIIICLVAYKKLFKPLNQKGKKAHLHLAMASRPNVESVVVEKHKKPTKKRKQQQKASSMTAEDRSSSLKTASSGSRPQSRPRSSGHRPLAAGIGLSGVGSRTKLRPSISATKMNSGNKVSRSVLERAVM